MSLETLQDFLLWCLALNYGFLLLWFAIFTLAHDGLYELHGRWFRLTEAQFDSIHYGAMAVYKLGVLLFNLVPYLALLIIS